MKNSEIPNPQILFSVDYFIANKQIRTKNNNYCPCGLIIKYLNMLFEKITDDLKKLKAKDDITNFLAYYYSELNLIKPFEKDNEKIIIKYLNEVLVFINLYLDFDYTLDFSKITEEDKNKLNLGFIESYTDGSLDLLKEFFSSMLSEPVKEHQI